jgi:hypothetical protein
MILFYPHELTDASKLYYVLKHLGIPHTNDIAHPDIRMAFFWDYSTVSTLPDELSALSVPLLNGSVTNVSKSVILRQWDEVAGTDSFAGQHENDYIVRKSELQSVKDIACYKDDGIRQDGYVYCKHIDSRKGMTEWLTEFRVVVMNRAPVMMYYNQFPESTLIRYPAAQEHNTPIYDISEVLTAAEIAIITRFCEWIGLDVGELDIMRHGEDGKIYCFDVNNIAGNRVFANHPEYIAPYSDLFTKHVIEEYYAD